MAKQEVAAAKTTALGEVNNDLFGQFAGEGLENVGATDILIPRLMIAQQMSPQINKKKAEYLEGLEIGQIFDVGTGDIFPDGITFLPVLYRKDYLEWAPRDTGKGLQGVHTDPAILDLCKPNEKKQPTLDNGNIIIETAQFFGLNMTAGRRPSFIPMASTQLKKARKWNTLATGEKLRRADNSEFTPPLFYRTYLLTTGEESNNEGDWSGWVINRGPTLQEIAAEFDLDPAALLAECKKMKDDIIGGKAQADVSGMDGGGAGGAAADPDAPM